MSNKIFVIDTSVILYDSSCIFSFKDNRIAIPICVLEEMDGLKKGNQNKKDKIFRDFKSNIQQ